MKVPVSWLSEYVDIDMSLDDLAHRLTMGGNEVDAIERTGWIDNVVVGHVLAVAPHPDADRLRLVTVDHGSGQAEVVCGAPNVAEGQKIAYASIGAVLQDAYSDEPGKTRKLKRSKIRGVVSEGMACSVRELGIGDDHDGILVLDDSAVIGTPIGEILGESVLDIELTPNRPDCLGVVGVARDVSAITRSPLKQPNIDFEATGPDVNSLAQVEIADPDYASASQFNIGQTYFDERQFAEAIEAYSATMELYPDTEFAEESAFRIGWASERMQEYEAAVEALQAAIRRHPNSKNAPAAQVFMARIYLDGLDLVEDAVTAYRAIVDGVMSVASIETDARSGYDVRRNAQYQIGKIYQDRRDPRAIQEYEALLKQFPEEHSNPSHGSNEIDEAYILELRADTSA